VAVLWARGNLARGSVMVRRAASNGKSRINGTQQRTRGPARTTVATQYPHTCATRIVATVCSIMIAVGIATALDICSRKAP
jgi:hypothetical protein